MAERKQSATTRKPRREKFEAWLDGDDLKVALALQKQSGQKSRAAFVRACLLSPDFAHWEIGSLFICRSHQFLNDLEAALATHGQATAPQAFDTRGIIDALRQHLMEIQTSAPQRGVTKK